MRINLIQPKMELRPMDTFLKSRMSPPLGLLVIAEILRKDNMVTIENENIEELQFDSKIDLAAISVTVDTFKRACQIAKHYKKKGIPIIAGGIHISALPSECEKFFDAVCIGPSETIWKDIIHDVKNGALKKRYECTRPITSADIASPAYDLIDHSKYLYTNVLFTSYGCPFRCNFCYNSCDAYKNLYVNKPIDTVIAEINRINKKHIMFIDDNLIGNPKWTKELLLAMKPLKLKWNGAVSANIVTMPWMLDLMKESGCQGLFIGFESLSKDALSNVQKTQNNRLKYEELVNEIHKRDIMINASFVFGLDGDDKDTFKKTADWVIENKIETVTSHILTPYPGTEQYNIFRKENRITDFDYSKYNTSNVVFQPKKLTKEELYNGYIGFYKEIYSIKNIWKRIPKSKNQIIPYLLFNLLYRKFGFITDWICKKVGYSRIGKIAAKLSQYI